MIAGRRPLSPGLETAAAAPAPLSFPRGAADTRSPITAPRDDAGWLITLSDLTLLLLCFFIFLYAADRGRAAAPPAAELPAAVEAAGSAEPSPAAEAAAEELPEPSLVTFAPGVAELPRQSLAALEEIAASLRDDPDLKLEIVGHTDDRPIATREFPTNWELSAARASAVARRLIEKGVAPERLSVQGYAAFRPVSENSDRQGRGANRRVEIRFYRDE